MRCRNILVVEDDAVIRETLREVLELEGFVVETAANGAEGLRALRRMEHPCLIFLDLMMPVMDGWQFLDELRGSSERMLSTIPVTVVSAAADAEEVANRHPVRVLKKPTDLDHFVRVAQECCGAPAPPG